MSDDETEVVRLADGRTLTVRAATPGDVDELMRMYESLSTEDRYRRFFSMARPQRRVTERLVDAAAAGGLWLVAVTDDGTIVADVGFTTLPDGDAELAITVTEPWRGWLGPFLLDVLAHRAAAHGIHNLRATVLLENRKMLRLAARRGCATFSYPDTNVIELTMASGDGMPGWPPADDRPRLLVEGCGGRWRDTHDAEQAGWDVITCAGPGTSRVPTCPVLTGGRCPLVDEADEVVLAFAVDDPRRAQLAAAHHAAGLDVPVVMDEDWNAQDVVPPGNG
jgi:RimJ/RimL family protein N-acetyltransferase